MNAQDEKALSDLATLRNWGFSVAVHNDYRQGGERRTFWLLTHPSGRWIKGEGVTDGEALTEALKMAWAAAVISTEKRDAWRFLEEQAVALLQALPARWWPPGAGDLDVGDTWTVGRRLQWLAPRVRKVLGEAGMEPQRGGEHERAR